MTVVVGDEFLLLIFAVDVITHVTFKEKESIVH